MTEHKIKETILDCFSRLKQEFYKKYKIEEYEEDTSLHILSKRDLIEFLPPPSINIIEIINASNNLKHEKGFLVKYDYTAKNLKNVDFSGSICSNEKQLPDYVYKNFGLTEEQTLHIIEEVHSSFTYMAVWEPDENWCLHFIPGDIIKNPEIFYREWEKWIFLWNDVPVLSQKFRRERFEDFNKIYGLKKDPILPFSEITKSASQIELFSHNLESLQESIAHIQLIPKVPKEIKTIFKRAKKLFVLGYFEYELFTVSEHYAYLALETAIKTRYITSLCGKATLEIPKKNLKTEMKNPTFFNIMEFCRKEKDWNVRSLRVNGEEFPHNGKKLLDWLEKNHLIRKWEKGIYEAGLLLRNYHSHPEDPSTAIPSAKLLHVIADEINYIYHKKILNVED